jgi:hypothetical protein
VRAALAPVFLGTAATAKLSPDLLEAVSALRIELASRFQAEVIAAVRAVRTNLPILLHTSPDPLAAGANPGALPDGSFGAVLQCGGVRSDAALVGLHAYGDALAKAGTPQPLAATLNIVAGMGSDRPGIAAWAEEIRDAGADELRLYHAGIASAADLAAIRTLS